MPDKETTSGANKAPSTSQKSGSNNKIVTVVAIVVGIFIVLGITAFFGAKLYMEKVVETAVEKAVTDKENNIAGVPESFPADDVTVYPNSEVVDSAESEGDVTLRLKTSDSVSKAAEFYKNKLVDSGWKEIKDSNFSGSSTLNAKKNGKQIYIFIATDKADKKTSILINITKN